MSKPIILTVDDEEQVRNAVERDLKRHFRKEYRVIKAGSGAEALESVHRLKQRDDAIALFLVDQRMPEMSGTEFLAEARGIYPEARKVLLTAYADTEAAISAINTCLAMAVDWRGRRSLLGTSMGGLSGPAIKPIALRAVFQVASAIKIPIVGIGGIATIDDVMEFLVAGASAIQIGTANFYDPTVTMKILDGLPDAIAELGANRVVDVVGTLNTEKR